jgi:inositol-pentakisphosphate 2-kinase
MALTAKEMYIPVLPLKTGIAYLSEGAANIVYRISVPFPTPPPSEIDEYGGGTPSPTEMEEYDYSGLDDYLRLFDSKLERIID